MPASNAYGDDPKKQFDLHVASQVVMGTASVAFVRIPRKCKLVSVTAVQQVAGGGTATPSVVTIKRDGGVTTGHTLSIAGNATAGTDVSAIVPLNAPVILAAGDVIQLDNNGASDDAAGIVTYDITCQNLW